MLVVAYYTLLRELGFVMVFVSVFSGISYEVAVAVASPVAGRGIVEVRVYIARKWTTVRQTSGL